MRTIGTEHLEACCAALLAERIHENFFLQETRKTLMHDMQCT